MIIAIESIVLKFRRCFSRKAAFHWFVLVIFGFIVRCDHHGATSFIRWLFLPAGVYDTMLRFFRATSWDLGMLLEHWVKIVINCYPVIKFEDRALLIGDGIKVPKESQKMPAVKSLHQESENSAKAEYIRGHHFGYVGLLVGGLKKAYCLPLQGELHEGVEGIRPAEGFAGKPATLVSRMAQLVIQKAKQTGLLCYATLDAYFATCTTFQIFKQALNEKGEQLVHLITRAKDNYVAYFYCVTPQGKFQKKLKFS